MDAHATDRSNLAFKLIASRGLNLVYYRRPLRHLRAGSLNIVPVAVDVHKQALAAGPPILFVHAGDQVPLKFRYPREIEVGTLIAWPDGRVWAAKGTIEGRRTTEQLAFLFSTGMNLPVADKRVSHERRQQAIAVAIAVVAVACGLPLPPCPSFRDRQGRTARSLAAESGLARFLHSWH